MNLFDFTAESSERKKTLNPFGSYLEKNTDRFVNGAKESIPAPRAKNVKRSEFPMSVGEEVSKPKPSLKELLAKRYGTEEESAGDAETQSSIYSGVETIEPVTNKEVVQPIEEQPGYIEKLATGLVSAPKQVIESGASLVERGLRTGLEGMGVKFKDEGEVGNLGYEVEYPKTTVKEDVLKMASGQLGTSIGVSAPIAYGIGHSVSATDVGGAVLGGIDKAMKTVARAAYKQLPGMDGWNDDEMDALTDVVVNSFGMKSANPTKIGGKKGVIQKVNAHPGTTLKNLGGSITNAFVREFETNATIGKIKDYVRGATDLKPQKIGETLAKYKLSGSVKNMSADAKTVLGKIWDEQLSTPFSRTTTRISGDSLILELRDKAKSANALDKPHLERAIADLESTLKGKDFSVEEVNSMKGSLQSKTQNVDVSSTAMKQVMDSLAGITRKKVIDTVKNDTGVDITKSFDEYSQLASISKAFEDAYKSENPLRSNAGVGSNGNMFMRFSEGLASVATPIGTTVGGVIYRLGNGLEFIGPKGISSIADVIKNSGILKVRNPEVLSLPEGAKPIKSVETPLLPRPKLPEGTSYPRTDASAESLRSENYGIRKPPVKPKQLPAPRTPPSATIPRTVDAQMGQFELRNAVIKNPQKASTTKFIEQVGKGEYKVIPKPKKKNVPKKKPIKI